MKNKLIYNFISIVLVFYAHAIALDYCLLNQLLNI